MKRYSAVSENAVKIMIFLLPGLIGLLILLLIIEGAKEKTSRSHIEAATAEDVFNKFNELSEKYESEGICRKKNDIIKEIAVFFNIPKNQAYDMYEEINRQTQDDR